MQRSDRTNVESPGRSSTKKETMDTVFHPNQKSQKQSEKQYRDWLTSINGIGPVLAKRIVAAYPDYFVLAKSSPQEISEHVKGMPESKAEIVLNTIARAQAAEELTVRKPTRPTTPSGSPVKTETSISAEPPVREEEAGGEASVGFFSKPLDFRPVIDKPAHQPVSIDALKRKHELRQNSISEGSLPETDPEAQRHGFATFKRPDVHVIYNENKTKPKSPASSRRWLWVLMAVLLVLFGTGLIGYAGYRLYDRQQAIDTEAINQDGEAAVSTNPALGWLTFRDALTERRQEMDELLKASVDQPDVEPEVPEDVVLPTEEVDEEPEDVTPDEEPVVTVEPADITVNVLNGSGRVGLAGQLANTLRSESYQVGTVGNANNFGYAQTTLFHTPANQAKAERLAQSLEGDYDVTLSTEPYAGQTVDVVLVIGAR